MKIAVLSRFQSPSEQARIIREIKAGGIDLVIGTHRLLSRDIHFKDLGLLIIDEEQKFGVAHKERLKELKKNVDALALTATPIPRTLYMSMVGIRDISMIETPPEDRHPVRTYVMEFNEKVIAEAIRREMARKGQVFLSTTGWKPSTAWPYICRIWFRKPGSQLPTGRCPKTPSRR